MDRDATFRQIYDAYRDRIYRMCCTYVRDDQDRKDLYQDVMQNIWKGLDRFRGDAALSTWIYRITVNTSLGHLARQKSLRKRSSEYCNHLRDQGAQDNVVPDPGDVERLYSAIAQLPLIDMIVMSMVLDEASSREIAESTGLTEGNVRVRIHRAKERLRQMLDDESGSDESDAS